MLHLDLIILHLKQKEFWLLHVIYLQIVYVVDADGKIRHWHYTSGKLLSTIDEPDNAINGLHYRNDGLKFVTVGSDIKVRIYDSLLMKNTITMDQGTENETSGHSNRIFCAKFHPLQPDVLISGGWDDTIQVKF